jgi:NAD(P)-dependent dehydrogenase (short-subunit alcohol dehydrogenase family)
VNSLAAEHVLVTGAGRGIGAAIAAAAARVGAAVTCLDLDAEAAAAVAAGIVGTGARAAAVGCDLTSLESLDRALKQCEEELSPVTVLIANAGGAAGDSTPFLELTAHQWHAMIDRNLTTAFHCGLALGRRFASRGGGTMVFVTSFAAEIAPAGLVHYSAAKGGVRQLVRGMAQELGPHGIRVNAVAPGFVATEGNRATLGDPEIAAGIQRRVPLRRIGEPADIASAAIYLASADSSYVTGATLMVDGGWLVRD